VRPLLENSTACQKSMPKTPSGVVVAGPFGLGAVVPTEIPLVHDRQLTIC
jgi:hypothetical protein